MNSLIPFRRHSLPVASEHDLPAFHEIVLRRTPTECQQVTLIGLDNSPSTDASGALQQLRNILPKFIADLQADAQVRSTLLASFSVFDVERPWRITAPFAPVMELKAPTLHVSSSTPLCTRIIESVELLKARRKLVSSALQVDQHPAWLVEKTDGQPMDGMRADEARRAVREIAAECGIYVWLFGVGPAADMQFLNSIAQPGRPAEHLTSDRDFARLFTWVANSLKSVSRSLKGAVIEIESVSGRKLILD